MPGPQATLWELTWGPVIRWAHELPSFWVSILGPLIIGRLYKG